MGERKVIMVERTYLWWRKEELSLETDAGIIVDTDDCEYSMVPIFFPAPMKGDVLVIESRPDSQTSRRANWRVVEEEDPDV